MLITKFRQKLDGEEVWPSRTALPPACLGPSRGLGAIAQATCRATPGGWCVVCPPVLVLSAPGCVQAVSKVLGLAGSVLRCQEGEQEAAGAQGPRCSLSVSCPLVCWPVGDMDTERAGGACDPVECTQVRVVRRGSQLLAKQSQKAVCRAVG